MTELQQTIVALFTARDRVTDAIVGGNVEEAHAEFHSQAEAARTRFDPKGQELVAALQTEVEHTVAATRKPS